MSKAAVAEARLLAPGVQDDPGSAREPARAVPGQPDMWYFVLFEGLLFATYFIIYMLYRMRDPELFLQSQQHLDQDFGAANTIILLTSSWLIARCVRSARSGNYPAAMRELLLTAFSGVLFVGLKLVEWSLKVHEGFEFSTNEFFWFYYFLTAIHVVHVLIGLVFLGVVGYQLASPERRSQEVIETGATYWHMVDFLWVFIFALLYIMR